MPIDQKTCVTASGEPLKAKETDTAALSSGVIAVAVTIYIIQGHYTLMSVVVSATVLTLFYGYVWYHLREWQESLGVAAVVSLAALHMFGFGVEYWLATDRWSLLWHDDPLNCGTVHDPQQCKGDDKETRVPDAWLLIIWLGVGFAVFCADRFNQSRLRQRAAFAPTEG